MTSKNIHTFFWTLTTIVVLFLGVLSFLSYQSLQGSDSSKALATYQQYNSLVEYITPVFFVILLLISNFLFAKGWSSFYVWVSLAVFTAFTLLDYMALKDAFFAYKKSQGMQAEGASIAKMMGGLLIILGAFITGVNYFILRSFKNNRLSRLFTEDVDKAGSQEG